MPISQTEGYFEEKAFSSVKTKTNPNFAVKLAETLSVIRIAYFKDLLIRVMECTELN